MLLEKIQLEPGEIMLVETRRHWFVIFGQLFSLFMVALIPLLVYFFAKYIGENYQAVNNAVETNLPILIFLYVIWLMCLWIGTFNIWTNYYLDVLTITNRRIILTNQKGFFRRNVASFRLERLQDMNVEINGLIATLLDYGTINAETAGHAEEEFRAVNVPHPRELKAKILSAADNLITTTPNHADGV
jgi:ABC-type multidrug transport system fused ATPase/permease subunit